MRFELPEEYEPLLARVEKPGRYAGGETNAVVAEHRLIVHSRLVRNRDLCQANLVAWLYDGDKDLLVALWIRPRSMVTVAGKRDPGAVPADRGIHTDTFAAVRHLDKGPAPRIVQKHLKVSILVAARQIAVREKGDISTLAVDRRPQVKAAQDAPGR